MALKDWLSCENARNKQFAGLYVAIMKKAFRVKAEPEVLIGHHLTFELDGDLNTENEIPSADCLMFDHYIMGQVFGDQAISIMQHLAATPCESRDGVLASYWACLNQVDESVPESGFGEDETE
jgi:hypothetical protein